MGNSIKIVETPRDAWQGLNKTIPVDYKVQAIQLLLSAGFDIVDVGSFVSEKAVPEMANTDDVIAGLDLTESKSQIMVLCGNAKGAEKASAYQQINYISFPFSVSETFLQKNINSGFQKAWFNLVRITEICNRSGKFPFIYLTMAFGNPYGDPVNLEIIHNWVDQLNELGIKFIGLSDIIGVAKPEFISATYALLTEQYPQIEFGLHLHIVDDDWYDKVDAAFKNGCRIFDGVINGMGGCPMTGYEMLGNIPTSNILTYASLNGIFTNVNQKKFSVAKSFMDQLINPVENT
ncbi:MAG: hypothetical protein JW731_15630 [Bacteroidales bacterium]|nr:hypothetical protein [Bacteroidales bacterium]